MDRLEDMIRAQLELQQALGSDPLTMTDDERIQYIKDQMLFCIAELHEALAEIGCKPWATSRHINKDAAFGELRDTWQFLTNIMLAVTQWDPAKLAMRLESELYRKHTVNYQRIGRYDGVSTKCPVCKRALDDESVACAPDLGVCAA